jgi:hypothetical protein
MKTSISISLILLCIFVFVKAGPYTLNGNTFRITNVHYNHANLRQWGPEWYEICTYENWMSTDQLWILEKDDKYTDDDWYYIENVHFAGDRIYNLKQKISTTNGKFIENQLWKFEPVGDPADNVYVIKNKANQWNSYEPNEKLTKFGQGDGDINTSTGAESDNQHWKLTARYEAESGTEIIMCFHNEGTTPVEKEITYIQGVTTSYTDSLTVDASMEASMELGLDGIGASAKVKEELTSSLSQSSTKNWSKTEKTTFTVPARADYKVSQKIVNFISDSDLKEDVVLHSSIITVEQAPLSSLLMSAKCQQSMTIQPN